MKYKIRETRRSRGIVWVAICMGLLIINGCNTMRIKKGPNNIPVRLVSHGRMRGENVFIMIVGNGSELSTSQFTWIDLKATDADGIVRPVSSEKCPGPVSKYNSFVSLKVNVTSAKSPIIVEGILNYKKRRYSISCEFKKHSTNSGDVFWEDDYDKWKIEIEKRID